MAEKDCREVDPILVCFTPTGGEAQPILLHTIYELGEYHGTIYTDLDGNPIDVSEGEVGDCEPKTIQCWQDKFFEGGLDNTFTNFNHTNQVYTVTFSDGTTGSFGFPSATNWTDQVNQMATGLGSIMPWAVAVESFCTNGCGGLPAPVVDLSYMAWRYVGFRVCPGDAVPTSVVYESDQTKAAKDLVVQFIETDTIYIDRCVDCDGNETFLVDGEAYEPVCAIPCVEDFPELPIPACTFETQLGCDIEVVDADGEVLDDPIATPITVVYTICGGDITVTYMVDENNTLVEYNDGNGLLGYFGDCDTLEPIEGPLPECPEGAVFEPVTLKKFYHILDNSLFTDANGTPLNHLQNGNNYELTFHYDDGSSTPVQQTADPYYNNFIGLFASELGCTVKAVCANHTAGKGCHPIHVANLAAYPAYDAPTFPADPFNNLTNPDRDELWASGWLLDCVSCGKLPTHVEITASNDPAFLGATKQLIVHQFPDEIIYQAVTCDGLFYKDCDGNTIEAPQSDCCLPPAAAAMDDDCGSPFQIIQCCDYFELEECELENPLIYSPVKATANLGNLSASTDTGNHIDKSGLTTPFVDGQNWNTYNPPAQTHTSVASTFESYFQTVPGAANGGGTPIDSANPLEITYDMGQILTMDRFSIWGEEAHSPKEVTIKYSLDGTTFQTLDTDIQLTNAVGSYPGQVVQFSCAVAARYAKLCFTDSWTYRSPKDTLAIGEIAFGGVVGGSNEAVGSQIFYKLFTCGGLDYVTYTPNADGDIVLAPYEIQGDIVDCSKDQEMVDKLCSIKDLLDASLEKECDLLDLLSCPEIPPSADYVAEFKASSIDTIDTDKGPIAVNQTFPTADVGDNGGTEINAATASIQAFLDANGGGTVVVEYVSQSILNITVTGSPCVFLKANSSSNIGAGQFTESNSVGAQAGGSVFDKMLDKLCAIEEALTAEEPECLALDVGATIDVDGSLASLGTLTQFPLTSPAGSLSDFTTPLSLPADDCLTALDPQTMFRVRVCWDCHDLVTGTNGTTGSQVIIGPLNSSGSAVLVGWSSTNTSTQNTLGGPNGFMATTSTDLDKADRWLDFDIPLSELLAGTSITTSAFGASITGVTESLRRQKVKMLTDLTQFGCEVCDDCGC